MPTATAHNRNPQWNPRDGSPPSPFRKGLRAQPHAQYCAPVTEPLARKKAEAQGSRGGEANPRGYLVQFLLTGNVHRPDGIHGREPGQDELGER